MLSPDSLLGFGRFSGRRGRGEDVPWAVISLLRLLELAPLLGRLLDSFVSMSPWSVEPSTVVVQDGSLLAASLGVL